MYEVYLAHLSQKPPPMSPGEKLFIYRYIGLKTAKQERGELPLERSK